MLPEIDGLEICRKIRDVIDIPILLVSAKKEDLDKIKGLGYGADDYIVKPFSPSELVARVIAHISRYQRLTAKNAPKEKTAPPPFMNSSSPPEALSLRLSHAPAISRSSATP